MAKVKKACENHRLNPYFFSCFLMMFGLASYGVADSTKAAEVGTTGVNNAETSRFTTNREGEVSVLGISSVIYIPKDSRIYKTASNEIQYMMDLKKLGRPQIVYEDKLAQGTLFLSTLSDTALSRELIEGGKTNLHNIPQDVDAYEIFMYKNTVILLGTNERSLLNAVYEYQEYIQAEKCLPADYSVSRILNPAYRIFHGRFDSWPASRSDIRYIAHLGATHNLVTHDWQGDNRRMQGYVTVEPFPNAVAPEEVKRNRIQLRKMIEDNKDFGLESALWITEIPCQGGPWIPDDRREYFLTRYEREVLSDSGTYQGMVLCFSHPKVQQYYADVIKQFFADFPEISILFIMGIDAEGEFCDPVKCSRCRGLSKFEQRDRLIHFLVEHGTKARPGLRVLTTNWGWDARSIKEFTTRQRTLPSDSGVFMAAQYDGWQPERQLHSFMTDVRNICTQKQQLFIGYDNLHWGDDSVHGITDIQDFPLGIAAKLKRWGVLNVDGVFDHWGTWPEEISTNSIACREFFLNPWADPTEIVKSIATRQFGSTAAPYVMKSWSDQETAHKILSNISIWCPEQWPNWYAGRTIIPIPDGFSKNKVGLFGFEKQANNYIYNEGALQERLESVYRAWKDAKPLYEQAIAAMDQAIKKVDQESLFYRFWWDGPGSIPSPQEHLERQKLYLEAISKVYWEIGTHFGLQALYESVKNEPTQYYQIARERLEENRQACLKAADFLENIVADNRCRADRSERLPQFVREYRDKAKAIQHYVAQNKNLPSDTNKETSHE